MESGICKCYRLIDGPHPTRVFIDKDLVHQRAVLGFDIHLIVITLFLNASYFKIRVPCGFEIVFNFLLGLFFVQGL